jgi:hypothetical protein
MSATRHPATIDIRSPLPPISVPSERAACQAARAYAQRLAIDDASYVQKFLIALNVARAPIMSAIDGMGSLSQFIPSSRLLGIPAYATNARMLYSTRQQTSIGARGLPFHEYPYCVAINFGRDRCAGAIIARNLVVTAAHCVRYDAEANIEIGGGGGSPIATIPAARVITHPAFDPITHANDMAAILLDEDIDTGQKAGIASLEEIAAARFVRMVGYGGDGRSGTDFRQAVDVPIASPTCLEGSDRDLFGCHPSAELVTGKPALRSDNHFDRSGTPCLIRHGTKWSLAGIFSRPIPGYSFPSGDGSIFVLVDHYRDWLRSIPRVKW